MLAAQHELSRAMSAQDGASVRLPDGFYWSASLTVGPDLEPLALDQQRVQTIGRWKASCRVSGEG